MDQRLIFDFGLHSGRDTDFFLQKGFKVIALEANPVLSEACSERFAEFVSSGELVIVDKALWDRDGETVAFFVNDSKDDWSSLYKGVAEKGEYVSREITVPTTTLNRLIQSHGVPYYAKCDMENADAIFARQLLTLDDKPGFVSVEINDCTLPALLYAAGYDRFQVINQYQHPWTKAPEPAREGKYVDFQFDHHSTGPFGRELDPNGWYDFDGAIGRISALFRLKRADPQLVIGWFDLHATTREQLSAGH